MNILFDNTINHKIKCEFIDCFAGMGLAGTGICFLKGIWWHQSCPMYKNENEALLEWKKECDERDFNNENRI